MLVPATLAPSQAGTYNEPRRSADMNAVDKDGRAFLQNVAKSYSEAAIEPFLGKDANLDAIDKDRRTPLYIVAESDKGADIEAAETDGRKNLHDATVVQLISPIPQGFAQYNGSIARKGLETCKKCGRWWGNM